MIRLKKSKPKTGYWVDMETGRIRKQDKDDLPDGSILCFGRKTARKISAIYKSINWKNYQDMKKKLDKALRIANKSIHRS